jgi:cyclic-di-AMP phosphodiesterase PgpH
MWFKKKSLRRQAVAEDSAPRRKFWNQLSTGQWRFVLASLLVLLALVGIELIPAHQGSWQGGPAPVTIVSPVTFQMPDPDAYQQLQQQARLHTSPILTLNTRGDLLTLISTQLINLPSDVESTNSPDQLPLPLKKRFPVFDSAALEALHYIVQSGQSGSYVDDVNLLVGALKSHPIVDQNTWESIAQSSVDQVVVEGDKTNPLQTVSWINVGMTGPQGLAFRPLVQQAFPEPLWDTVTAYLANLNQPMFVVDAAATDAASRKNAAVVQMPMTVIHQGQVIVTAGQSPDAKTLRTLNAARHAWDQQVSGQQPWAGAQRMLGFYFLALVLCFIGALYIGYAIIESRIRRPWVPVILLLLSMLIAKIAIFLNLTDWIYAMGLLPVLLTSIVLVIAYPQRFVLGLTALNALVVTLSLGADLVFFLTTFTTAAVLILGLREIRTRTQMVRVALLDALVAGAIVLGFGFSRGPMAQVVPLEWSWIIGHSAQSAVIWHDAFIAAGAVFAAGFILLLLLPLIEQIFGVTTAMTLLELSDTNRPLLRRLALEAPGTFNHSLVLGVMAEAAARDIGADALLCRVGAYYHDIGKLLKPPYFVENMAGSANRHEKLSPAMSLLVIVGHVKDGLELAREYHLPPAVWSFIAEHHGTTVVEYFFQAALQRQARETLAGGESDSRVSETEFRYPGPKPHSRETAILMICDGAEGIVRAMPEPSPSQIEGAVHQLIIKRLLDGQFDACNLTMAQLNVIELSLIRTLVGVYHGRLAYPSPATRSRPAPISRPA